MKDEINKTSVGKLEPGDELYDTLISGFSARKLPSGLVTYSVRYRNVEGKQRRSTLGHSGKLTPAEARTQAKKEIGQIVSDVDVSEVKITKRTREGATVDAILDRFVDEHVKKLTTADEVVRQINKHVRPALGHINVYDLVRSDVTKMLSKIAKENGEVQSDRVLATVSKLFNWYALDNEKFKTPLVKGMARTKMVDRMRSRTLDEQELCDLWLAIDELAAAGALTRGAARLIRTLMFTTMRLEQVRAMEHREIKGNRWVIPKARNMKTKVDHLVFLTSSAQAEIGKGNSGYIFTNDDKTPVNMGGHIKDRVDAKIAEIRKRDGREAMPHWTWHDLRRTGRSMLSRLTTPDVAERVIGHLLPGMRRNYDVYGYETEKQAAITALEGEVLKIVRKRRAQLKVA